MNVNLTPPTWLNRRTLLYAMLGALACAALSGVAAVFVSGADMAWRVALMALAAGVAAAIMMPMSVMAEKRSSRSAGLFGMAWAVGLFLLVVSTIWTSFGSGRVGEALLQAIGATLLCGIPGIAMLLGIHSAQDRFGALVGFVACAIAWLVMMYGSLQSVTVSFAASEDWWASGAGVLGGAIGLGGCLVGAMSQREHPWRHVGVLASIAGVAMVLYDVWIASSNREYLLVGVFALAGAIAHANLARRVTLKGAQLWVRWIAVGAMFATCVLLTLAVYYKSEWDDALGLARLTTGSSLVAISSTLALVVLVKLNTRTMRDEIVPPELTSVTLECPRCNTRQRLSVNGAACEGCRLRIMVKVSLPMCTKCEYDLSNCRDGVCPECGTPIVVESGVAGV